MVVQVNLFQKLFLHQLTHNMSNVRLFIDEYMKTTSSEHVFVLTFKKDNTRDNFSYSKIRFFSSKQEILNILIFDASLAWLL